VPEAIATSDGMSIELVSLARTIRIVGDDVSKGDRDFGNSSIEGFAKYLFGFSVATARCRNMPRSM